jgi:predicted nucleic acid-binding protein
VLIDIDIGKRQVYVKGRRLHHGLVGAIAILAGIALAVHDRKDFPWSIHD